MVTATSPRAEAAAAADARFDRMDANGDGKLTPDEMGPRGGRGGGDMPPAPPPGPSPPPPPAPGRVVAAGCVAPITDGDGAITREEFRATAMKRFDQTGRKS